MSSQLLSRRAFLRNATAVAGGLVATSILSACAPVSAPAGGGQAQPTAAAGTPATAEGGTITTDWWWAGDINPLLSTGGRIWSNYLHERLVTPNYNHTETLPALAESWDVSDDGTVITFHLRRGVTWHDGEPFTARDVDWSFHAVAHPDTATYQKAFVQPILGVDAYNSLQADRIEGIQVMDDYTIQMTLQNQYPTWITHRVAFLPNILPAHLLGDVPFKDIPQHEYVTKPMLTGLGPYKLVEFVKDEYAVWERHEDYYRGRPNIERVIVKNIQDASVKVLAMQNREIDDIAITIDDSVLLKEDPNIGIYAWLLFGRGIYVNHAKPYLADKRVRLALLHALDRQTILDTLWRGEGQMLSAAMVGQSWLDDDGQGGGVPLVPYDPAKARELLAEAGWDSNQELAFLTGTDDLTGVRQPAAIQAYFEDVGVKMQILALDAPSRAERMTSGDWDLSYGTTTTSDDDPTMYVLTNLGCKPEWGANNSFGYCNPAIDELLIQATFLTPESDEWKAALTEAYTALAEDVAVLPLFQTNALRAYNKRIQGTLPNLAGTHMYYAIEKWSLAS